MPRELLFFNFCIPQDTKLRAIIVTLVVAIPCDVSARVIGVVDVKDWPDWVPCRAASMGGVRGGVGAPVSTSRIRSCGGRRVPAVAVPRAGRRWGLVGPPLERPIRVPLLGEACLPQVWAGRNATRAWSRSARSGSSWRARREVLGLRSSRSSIRS